MLAVHAWLNEVMGYKHRHTAYYWQPCPPPSSSPPVGSTHHNVPYCAGEATPPGAGGLRKLHMYCMCMHIAHTHWLGHFGKLGAGRGREWVCQEERDSTVE